jgi:hypothetical protein
MIISDYFVFVMGKKCFWNNFKKLTVEENDKKVKRLQILGGLPQL